MYARSTFASLRLPVTPVWAGRSFARAVWDPLRPGCGCDGSTTSWCATGGVWTTCACVSSADDRTRDRRYRRRHQTARPGRTPSPCCTNRSSSCLQPNGRKRVSMLGREIRLSDTAKSREPVSSRCEKREFRENKVTIIFGGVMGEGRGGGWRNIYKYTEMRREGNVCLKK